MKIRLVVALIGLAMGLAVPTNAQQTNTPDPQPRERLLAFVTKYEEAINNGDAAAAAAFFAKDAVLVNDTGPVYGREAIERYYADMFQNVFFSNYIIMVDQNFPQIIGNAGDEAWSTGEWRSTVRGENFGPVEQKGYWSVIDTREGDATKIRMLTWNVTPLPPAPAQTNAVPSSAQEQKAVDPQVRQQIEAVFLKFQDAYNNRDAATIGEIETQNAIELRSWQGLVSGRSALEKMFETDFKSNPHKMFNKIVQLYSIGNAICEIANSYVGGSKVQTVVIYVRDGDTWKRCMTYVNHVTH